MPKIGIIAAMEREVAPLIKGWKSRTLYQGGHSARPYRLFENLSHGSEVSLLCGGVGYAAARRATEALIQETNPELVVSVGFAGALDRPLHVGDVVLPKSIINSADGSRTDVGSGNGVLVSSATVAGKEQKSRFAKMYGAMAVDMEATAVAQGAVARGVEFAAIKVISDEVDFEMPALDRFVMNDGRFQTFSFALHVAMHPKLWGTAIALARNSTHASRALTGAITDYLRRENNRLAASQTAAASTIVGNGDMIVEREFAGAHTTTAPQAHTLSTEK
jgi:adenosylhomocysteine nucleosidase